MLLDIHEFTCTEDMPGDLVSFPHGFSKSWFWEFHMTCCLLMLNEDSENFTLRKTKQTNTKPTRLRTMRGRSNSVIMQWQQMEWYKWMINFLLERPRPVIVISICLYTWENHISWRCSLIMLDCILWML